MKTHERSQSKPLSSVARLAGFFRLIVHFKLLWSGVGLLDENILAGFHEFFSLFGKCIAFVFLDDLAQVLHAGVHVGLGLDAECANVKVGTAQ